MIFASARMILEFVNVDVYKSNLIFLMDVLYKYPLSMYIDGLWQHAYSAEIFQYTSLYCQKRLYIPRLSWNEMMIINAKV